jgi:hypothetical protein
MLPELPYPELELRRLFGKTILRMERIIDREGALGPAELEELEALQDLAQNLLGLLFPTPTVVFHAHPSEEEGL